MINSFKALWASTPGSDPNDFSNMHCEVRQTKISELSLGDVTIKTEYSGLNFKDALAITGKGKILRQLPLIPGVDFSGEVVESKSSLFKVGDGVLVNGCNVGEKLCGGFSEYVRVPADILIKRPENLSSQEAMIYGTAGFTAALAIHQLELNGLRPEKGVVLVTGATGGVGSLALSFLNHLGYETEAWTRKESMNAWLEKCGAAKVTNVKDKDFSTRSLESVMWSCAIDNVGSDYLSYILPRIDLWGSIASIGLAKSEKLESTVYPFILRGVNILGISSNNCPFKLREKIWAKMASVLKPKNLEQIVSKTVSLDEIGIAAESVVKGQHFGRVLVKY